MKKKRKETCIDYIATRVTRRRLEKEKLDLELAIQLSKTQESIIVKTKKTAKQAIPTLRRTSLRKK